MNTCETCKWWSITKNPLFEDMGKCNNDDVFFPISFGYKHARNNMCGVGCCNTEDVFVGKNFGCIHWEGKE